jgi:hypothetical protein
MGNYQELVFYQKARQVVKVVDTLVKSWPKTMQAQEISRQLFRSATSIGANIAEGHGRHQGTEYIHYLIIAQDCQLGNTEKIDEAVKLNSEVVRMITSTISTLRAKQVTKNVREDNVDYIADTNV